MENEFDVVVVGAGISGIGAGAHFNLKCPDQTYVICLLYTSPSPRDRG